MLTITVNLDGTETVYTFPDLDVKAVRNDILDPAQWIADAFAGKVNNCKKRMVNPAGPYWKLIVSDPSLLLVEPTLDNFVRSITSRPDYKDRAAREAEARAAEARAAEEARRAALVAAKLEAAAGNDAIM